MSAGNIGASLLDTGVIPIRHCFDKFGSAGEAARFGNFLITCVFIPPLQITLYRTGEQFIFLQDHCYRIPQHFYIVVFYVHPAHAHRTGGNIVQAGNELHKGGFGRTRAADNPHRFSRPDNKVRIVDYFFIGIRSIHKIGIGKAYLTVFYLHHRMLRIGDVRLLIQNFCNAVCGRTGNGNHHKDHRKHHQAHHNLRGIRKQRHQRSGS